MQRLTFILPRFKARTVPRRRVPSALLPLAAEANVVEGITVDIIDAESAALDTADVLKMLAISKPDAIGISICSPTFPSGINLIKLIREKMPDVIIVVGGKLPTHCWESVSKIEVGIDALVRGEGEYAVSILANVLSSGANRQGVISALAELPNVWVPGKPVAPVLPPSIDLRHARPWPFEVLSQGLHYYHGDRMLIEYSRGCPGRCSYCLASRDRQYLSFRPASQVVDTLAYLRTQGFTSFFFTDDDFAASPHHIQHLLEGIIAQGLQIEFDANVRPDSLVRCANIAPLLRKAGCRCLWLGIESGSPSILHSYGKGFDRDTCTKAVAVALSAAKVVRTNWIIGAPLETEETIRASINFAHQLRQLGPHLPHISFMVPYPGTPVCDEACSLGLISSSRLEKLEDTTHGEPVMPSFFLPKVKLKELFREFHLKYYSRDFLTSVPPSVADEALAVLNSAAIDLAIDFDNQTFTLDGGELEDCVYGIEQYR